MSTGSDFLVIFLVPLMRPWCLGISACTNSTVPGNLLVIVFIIQDQNPLRFMYTSVLTMLLIYQAYSVLTKICTAL